MSINKPIIHSLLLLIAVTFLALLITSGSARAGVDNTPTTAPSSPTETTDSSNPLDDVGIRQADGTAKCGTDDDNAVDIAVAVNCGDDENPVYAYAIAIINFISAGAVIMVIVMISIGGIQYMTAGGNPQKTEAAIQRIIQALVGLATYLFLYAFLQWVIPGGPF